MPIPINIVIGHMNIDNVDINQIPKGSIKSMSLEKDLLYALNKIKTQMATMAPIIKYHICFNFKSF